jgi:ATP-dependent Lhr-like helicase
VRAHALARTLLDRHGVVTRGAVAAEGVEGGFSATYRVLSVFEESGQARRGYVVEGLGAAQFAMDGAVDRLRAVSNARDRGETLPGPTSGPDPFTGTGADPFATPAPGPFTGSGPGPFPAHDFAGPDDSTPSADHTDDPGRDGFPGAGSSYDPSKPAPGEWISPRDYAPQAAPPWQNGGRAAYDSGFSGRRTRADASRAVVLAAADPANAYGAALPWPEPPTGAGHKPGRKAGSLVVLVDGELTLYMERGGKTLLAWAADPDGDPGDDPRLHTAAEALASAARAGSLGTVTVERVNGAQALTSPVGTLLEGAGFIATPRGLRLRA